MAQFINPLRAKHYLVVSLVVVAALLTVGAVELATHWPFSQAAIVASLRDSLHAKVAIDKFQNTYFPPGCIAEGVTVTSPESPSPWKFHRITIQASYSSLFGHHIGQISLIGGDVSLAGIGFLSGPTPDKMPAMSVGTILANASVVQIGSEQFELHKLEIKPVGTGDRAKVTMTFRLSRPPSEVTIDGQFGPFDTNQPGKTPLSGTFRLQKANLGVFSNLDGTLSAQGKFNGVLSHINVSGATDSPDFEANRNHHPHQLKVDFRSVVNGLNGDTNFDWVRAELDRTTIIGHAAVVQRGTDGRTIELNVDSGHGRVEDLLLLFIKSSRPPMVGPIDFKTRVVVPPEQRPFTRRVVLDGSFEIGSGSFTNPKTRSSVESLSEHAEGEPKSPPEPIREQLKGEVSLRNGIVDFSTFAISVPGANADLTGTFNLVNQRVDLHGKMAMQAELSKTTTGAKSVFLKLLDPFFKRKQAGSVVPVSITGTYQSPEFQALMAKKK